MWHMIKARKTYRKTSMIHEFLNWCEAWVTSWNYPDLLFFFSHVMKISRFPWKLKHKKRDSGQGLKGSLLNLWHIKWCLKYSLHMSFSKIYEQNRIRTPPPPPLLQPWKWYQPLSEPNQSVLLIMRGIFIDDMHAI